MSPGDLCIACQRTYRRLPSSLRRACVLLCRELRCRMRYKPLPSARLRVYSVRGVNGHFGTKTTAALCAYESLIGPYGLSACDESGRRLMTQARWCSGVRRFPALAAVLALVLALLTPAIGKAEEWSPPEAVYVSET